MADVQITDNSAEVRAALEQAKASALEIIGGKIESYAKGLVAPLGPKGKPMRTEITAQVKQSIKHKVENDGGTVVVGSNLDFAA